MLHKKLAGCTRDHLSIEMKQNKNLVLKFSTAAYEFAKACIGEFLNLSCFWSEFAYTEEVSSDEQGINVETRFKVVNRKVDGNPGKVSKLTIICYHTTSSMLINGSKVDLFVKEGLALLKNKLTLNCEKLDFLNVDLENIMKAYQIPRLKTNTCTDAENSLCLEELPQTEDENMDTIEPNCDKEAGQNTICCEGCDSWYHYDCLGLTPAEINKIDTDIPYMCDN